MSNLFLYWIVAATSSLPLPPPFKPFPRRWMAQKSDQKSQLQNAGLTDMAIGFSHAIVSTSRFFSQNGNILKDHDNFFLCCGYYGHGCRWLQYIHLSQVVYTCSGLCPTTFLTNAWPNLKKRFMGGLNLLHPNLANLHCQKKATWIITGMAHEFMVCHRLSWKDMPHTPTNQAIPVRDHTSIDEWNAFLLCRILLHSSVRSTQMTDGSLIQKPFQQHTAQTNTRQQRRARRANACPCYTEAPRSASFQPLPQWDMPSRHILVDRSGARLGRK